MEINRIPGIIAPCSTYKIASGIYIFSLFWPRLYILSELTFFNPVILQSIWPLLIFPAEAWRARGI